MKQEPSSATPSPRQRSPEEQRLATAYWRTNLTVVGSLLSVWFISGYCISIFFVEWFNSFKVGNLGLGFWFSQQGSIVVFVALVWIYALIMDRVDRRFERQRQERE